MERFSLAQKVSENPGQNLDRWSRLIGSLSSSTWQKIITTRFTIAGCGRNGSLLAVSLAHMGLKQLSLIDPDILELHNLDAMDGVRADGVGQNKVDVLAEGLRQIESSIQVRAVPYSVTSLAALPLIKQSDFLVCCVDDDGSRWAYTILAALYCKPLLDVGTGVFRSQEHRLLGGDIRFVMPGEACLDCLGGFSRPTQIQNIRISLASELKARNQTNWRTQRSGSLRSLNQIAVGLGLRMIEDFFAGRITNSHWLQLIYDEEGVPQLEQKSFQKRRNCPICAMSGAGDKSLGRIGDLPLI